MKARRLLPMLIVVATPRALGQLPPLPGSADQGKSQQPRLFVPEPLQDIGDLQEGEKATAQWRLENHGGGDLIIEDVRAPCGCTVVTLSEEDRIVPPGQALALKAEYDSRNRSGPQRADITVYSNDPLESAFRLELTAKVLKLYDLTPPALLNLRALEPGATADRTLDVSPTEAGRPVELVGVALPPGVPLRFVTETTDTSTGRGSRVRFTVAEDAPPGPLSTQVTLNLKVGGEENTRRIAVRGSVVGEIVCTPEIIEQTRFESAPGRRLAPISIRSPTSKPFDILSVKGGPLLKVSFEEAAGGKAGTHYQIVASISEEAPPGPLSGLIEVRTTNARFPLFRIPVYAMVAEPLECDPPLALLFGNGTNEDRSRRVRINASPGDVLDIDAIHCDNRAITAKLIESEDASAGHIRQLEIDLVEDLPAGTYNATVTLATGLARAPELSVPVTIIVPSRGK